jgi:hypothetical protein
MIHRETADHVNTMPREHYRGILWIDPPADSLPCSNFIRGLASRNACESFTWNMSFNFSSPTINNAVVLGSFFFLLSSWQSLRCQLSSDAYMHFILPTAAASGKRR